MRSAQAAKPSATATALELPLDGDDDISPRRRADSPSVVVIVIIGRVDGHGPQRDAPADEEHVEFLVIVKALVVDGKQAVDAADVQAAGAEIGQIDEVASGAFCFCVGNGTRQIIAFYSWSVSHARAPRMGRAVDVTLDKGKQVRE